MSGRWRHLDRERGSPRGTGLAAHVAPEPPSPGPAEAATPLRASPEASLSPLMLQALGYYHLRDYQACADCLAAALESGDRLPGAQRLIGLSLGRLDDSPGAARALALAVTEAPDDDELRASWLSAQIRAGRVPEGVPEAPAGSLAELAGAARWLAGQERLGAGRPLEAARAFAEASAAFAATSPPEELPVRLGACYVGEAVSYLVAGQLEAAQQVYGRLSRRGTLPAGAADFARQLYEVAEAARELAPAERETELAPLAALIREARLLVRFYDQVRPVAMHWEGLP